MLMHVVAALIAVPLLTTLPGARPDRARDRPGTTDEPTRRTAHTRAGASTGEPGHNDAGPAAAADDHPNRHRPEGS
jgi:hypothetical protein